MKSRKQRAVLWQNKKKRQIISLTKEKGNTQTKLQMKNKHYNQEHGKPKIHWDDYIQPYVHNEQIHGYIHPINTESSQNRKLG